MTTTNTHHRHQDTPDTWRNALVSDLQDLGPKLAGRVVAPDTADEVVPAERYFDLDYLRSAILRIATTPLHTAPGTEPEGDVKLSIAASRFTRHYVAALTAAALVGLVRGIGLDLSAGRCDRVIVANIPMRVVIDQGDAGVVGCAERPTPWPGPRTIVETVAELREHVWRKLYGEHLAPLFAQVRQVTPVSDGLVWSNAAEWAAFPYHVGGVNRGSPLLTEVDTLLGAEVLPGVPGPNPLRGLLEFVAVDEPDFPLGVQTRRHCCVTYLLPERGGFLCGNCPYLPVEDRVDLVREQRIQSVGGGMDLPAAQRSIQHGRKRLRAPRSSRR